MSPGPVDTFVTFRDDLLEHVASAGCPSITLAGLGVLDGAARWIAAVESATGDELICLARALRER